MKNKPFNYRLLILCTLPALAPGTAHAELATGALTAGGVVVQPSQPGAINGFAGALGQPVAGSATGGGIWSGVITPDDPTAADAAFDSISIPDNLAASIGDTTAVPLYVKGNIPFAGLQAVVQYDTTTLDFVDAIKGPLAASDTDWQVESNVTPVGQVRLLLTANQTLKSVSPSAASAAVILRFKVKKASVSSFAFGAATMLGAANGDGLPFGTANGKLLVDNNDHTAPTISVTSPANGSFIR